MSEVYMMVTVIDRKDTERFLEFYAGRQADVQIVALGKGTAGSEILDYLGLEDAEKAVALLCCDRRCVADRQKKACGRSSGSMCPGRASHLRFP